jgi:uncharacterized protein (DUF924 family)
VALGHHHSPALQRLPPWSALARTLGHMQTPIGAPHPEAILTFWFSELEPAQWWRVDPALDDLIRSRFGHLHAAASVSELFAWRSSPGGRLAEVIVLDQFSRNMFRGTPKAFACDPLALALAQEAVSLGADLQIEPASRAFLYMPYMHSESRLIHAEALRLFATPGLERNLESARQHKAIIDRFARYPHRNAALSRESTPEELAFLAQPGSSF